MSPETQVPNGKRFCKEAENPLKKPFSFLHPSLKSYGIFGAMEEIKYLFPQKDLKNTPPLYLHLHYIQYSCSLFLASP